MTREDDPQWREDAVSVWATRSTSVRAHPRKGTVGVAAHLRRLSQRAAKEAEASEDEARMEARSGSPAHAAASRAEAARWRSFAKDIDSVHAQEKAR